MDELDRMYRRLVQNIRASFPDLLLRPFEVSQIYQHIIPYRLNRRELGLDTNEEYELTLMQLLSGAHGFLDGDDEMRRALQAELDSAHPDVGAFRGFATSIVSLAPDALRALESQPVVRSASSPVPEATTAQVALASRQTEELAIPRPGKRSPASSGVGSRTGEVAARPAGTAAHANPSSTPDSANCRYCGGELPEGREIVFCPHCGQNLTVKQCPACSTELELGWRFCVNCGRQVT